MPGGTLRKSDRTHIYCVPRRPPIDGAQPNEDCRHGTDCIFALDHDKVAEHNAMFRTGKGPILIQDPVPISDILRVSMLGVAGYTLWKRPEPLSPPQKCVRCTICRREYVNGTLWCYDGCWMPLTWLGVHERIMHIASVADRNTELEVCYGLTFKSLQPKLDMEGASPRNLPRDAFTSDCRNRRCKLFRLASPGSSASESGKAHYSRKQAQARAPGAAASKPAVSAVQLTTAHDGWQRAFTPPGAVAA